MNDQPHQAPRLHTRCRRCQEAYVDHYQHETGPRTCGVDGKPFLRSASKRRGMSCTCEEVAWLSDVLQALMRGRDCKVLARRPEIAAWHRKMQTARKSLGVGQ